MKPSTYESKTFHGLTLKEELASASSLEMVYVALCGKRPLAEDIDFLRRIFIGSAYPEPYIWPNRVAHLAGSLGGPSRGYQVARQMATNAMIGPSAVQRLAFELEDFRENLNAATFAGGLGVPFREKDERLEWFLAEIDEWSSAHETPYCDFLRTKTFSENEMPNYFLLLAASLLDCGIDAKYAATFTELAFLPPLMLNARRGSESSPAHISVQNTRYLGPATRRSKEGAHEYSK